MIDLDIFIMCEGVVPTSMSIQTHVSNGKSLEPFNTYFIIITLITNPMQYTEN